MTEQIEQNGQVREKDPYQKSRVMYIIEAAVEYFIALMISGAFLAKVTNAIGMTDAQTGIVSAFVSLGRVFQLINIFLARFTPVKRWVLVIDTINQLLFALIYAVPFMPVSQPMKIALFVLLMLGGRVLTGVASAPKTNWFMSLVPDGERGRFTADKEIVSLLSGIVFSFSMGALNDYFHKIGRSDIAFVICGFTIFSLAVIHMLTLLLSREKPVERQSHAVEKQMLLLMRDKTLWLIIVAGALSAIAQNSVTPFLGTYQNKELGFTLAFVSLISAVGSIVRAVVSHPIGYLADRTSFSKVLQLCLLIEGTGYLVLLLTKPANGHVLYVFYLILNAVAMAGINGGFMNLLFDYVAPERRVGALALQSIVSGTVGFLTTLVASRFVEYVQESGNQVFGIPIYAQQALAVIGLVVCLLNVLYLRLVVGRSQRPASSDTV